MAGTHAFEHLLLVRREEGPARYPQPRFQELDATKEHRLNRQSHSSSLEKQVDAVTIAWELKRETREKAGLPKLDEGIPLLLEIDPTIDIDNLRHFLGFEVVSEQPDGFVIVASADVTLAEFRRKLLDFVEEVEGSAAVAKIQELKLDLSQDERLRRILSDTLYAELPQLDTDVSYVVDVSFSCSGTVEFPKKPKRGRRKAETWAALEADWMRRRLAAYDAWDAIKDERLQRAERIIGHYNGEILLNIDGEAVDPPSLPDYFQLRLRLPGSGLKDLLLNHPFIFEAVEPDDVELPQADARTLRDLQSKVRILPPAEDAPTVCVIDSGIQEEHVLIGPAVDKKSSHCFLPGASETDVADYVANGGHGTRVAGAVLHGDDIPDEGDVPCGAWLQNARVLDAGNMLPKDVLPAALIREVIQRYHTGPRRTRIFNHSITANTPCRTTHMSAWAAEIDRLSNEYDVLVIQSVGNLRFDAPAQRGGVAEMLAGGHSYPDYLAQKACRLANPAQSLQALTVGSVCYDAYEHKDWRSFGARSGDPSAFSRSGLGIWDAIKPDVVEFGGDYLTTPGTPATVATPSHAQDCYPPLIRSTRGGGPAYARDMVGTSFTAPKVSRIAAAVESVLPDENCLLYRALIVQSARWPKWAHDLTETERAALISRIGYGVPDLKRATTNTNFRTTYITRGLQEIKQGGCHVYQVPIPSEVRRAGRDYTFLLEVTLSYAAEPRRTRRGHRGYLSTWLDWLSNRKGEGLDSFLSRALKSEDAVVREGQSLGWVISSRANDGDVEGVRRSIGTVQKDWVYLKSHQLPEDLCIAVRGHRGWSTDPDNSANYVLTVSLEVVGQEVAIYEPLRAAVEDLQAELGIHVEAEVDEAEAET